MLSGRNVSCVLLVVFLAVIAAYTVPGILDFRGEVSGEDAVRGEILQLPGARTGKGELAEMIYNRRSHRRYAEGTVPLVKIGDILWSTIGLTVDAETGPTRAAPSAGATDPLDVFLSAHDVEGLEAGIYRYRPAAHELEEVVSGDRSRELADAALGQIQVREAQAVVVLVAHYERTTGRYGDRGHRYVHIEAGHAAQNANLVAESLGLGAVMIGAFDDRGVRESLGVDAGDPLLVIPLGWRE